MNKIVEFLPFSFAPILCPDDIEGQMQRDISQLDEVERSVEGSSRNASAY